MSKSRSVAQSFWYFVCLSVLFYASALPYILAFQWPEAAVAQLYAVTAYVGYLGLAVWGAWLIFVLPAVLLGVPSKWVNVISVAVAAVLLTFVQVDGLVFATDRFHLSMLAIRVLGTPTALFAGFCAIMSVVLGTVLLRVSRGVQRYVGSASRRYAVSFSAAWAIALVISQGIHAWADVTYYVPVTSFTPYLPLYKPLTSKHLMARWAGVVDLSQARARSALSDLGEIQEGVLDYPKQALRCDPPEAPLNVLLIGLDAMRADYVDARVVPHIAEFARSSLRFDQHWSGGNGTRPGLFSFFYGIPATYWGAFYASQQAPVLIETFQANHYEFGIFPSNRADRLVGLERTAFRTIPNLPTTVGDVAATDGWLDWFEKRDKSKPFFSFLFYESAPGACPPSYERVSDVDVDTPGDAGRRACYETALHFADSQLARVLERIEEAGAYENTVVVITSDHGEEFNENGLGFRGHGSSYSRYQLRTPFLVRWPGRPPGTVERRTSHHDVAPTLLTEVLGCTNPPSDYSSGKDLFSDQDWEWLVAASYTSHAIVEPDQVTVSYGGYFEVRGSDYQLLDSPRFDSERMAAALRETGRFMRR